MGSFRKRLLVLIIGLGVVTQTVTLAAVLVSTRHTVEARAAEQLRSGGAFAEQLIRFRAAQLANGVAVLAADFGFREAVASGDAPTILSAARNNAQRIGADVVLLLDTHGRVLASTAPSAADGAGALASLLEDVLGERDRPLFRVLGENSYQFFLAPVRTPEIIAWVAMGFVADDSLAQRVRDLIGAQVAIVTHGDGGTLLVASTLPPTERRAAFNAALSLPAAGADPAHPGGLSRIARLGETEYLSYARPLDSRGAAVDVILLKPLQEVLAPYRDLRDSMLLIDGIALILAALIGAVLGRSATRPIGELVQAARRIEKGQYETAVSVSGGEEFESLAATFNAMQSNIAARDTVARLGETQFLVLAPGCSAERALLYAEQLLAVVRSGFHLAEVSLDLRLGCGVCLFPAHGASADELLQRVQVALEDADEARARVVMYRPGRDAEHRRRLTLITDLGGAIEQDRLTLVYQPKVTMATRWVKSLEALVRWTHPELGPVSPGEFVPLAESTGGSRRLTNWVLAAAIRQMGEWRRMGLELDLAVNLSAPDILDSDLGDAILALLRQHRVESSSLLLEITESAVMRDAQLAVRNMQLLRIAGVRFSIDDFGTGHSSLSQLSTLPVDELKIDRSFISEAASGSVTIVTSTIELGHRMGLKVVAEGVEDPAAWNLLRRLGCDFAQGYLISPPMPAAEVPAFIQQANQLLPASDSTLLQLRALEELAGRSGR